MSPRIVALIPAAGVGARASSAAADAIDAMPKQYQLINGTPLIVHTLRAISRCSRVNEIAVVVSPEDGWIDEIVAKIPSAQIPITVLRCGGASRAESVRNGLTDLRRRVEIGDWVLVHDAARCCVTPPLIDRLIDGCLAHPVGGLLAVPVADTLKRANDIDESSGTLDRAGLWAAQTPQLFRIGALLDAMANVDLRMVTDEASAMEAIGAAPQMIRGASTNFKVTFPEDFALAAALLGRETAANAR